MKISRTLLFGLLLALSIPVLGKSVVTIQNNTSIDYSIVVLQTGNIILPISHWTILSSGLNAWQSGANVFEFDPDTTMVIGDTVVFNVYDSVDGNW